MKRIMNNPTQLKICNWSLVFLTILTLASSIQLEASRDAGIGPVWFHIIVALLFVAFIIFHIKLHFQWKNWFSKFSKLKSPVTRILWWFFLFTALSGLISLVMWIHVPAHYHFGAVHGKIGFVMIAIAIGYTIKRIKFFKSKTSRK